MQLPPHGYHQSSGPEATKRSRPHPTSRAAVTDPLLPPSEKACTGTARFIGQPRINTHHSGRSVHKTHLWHSERLSAGRKTNMASSILLYSLLCPAALMVSKHSLSLSVIPFNQSWTLICLPASRNRLLWDFNCRHIAARHYSTHANKVRFMGIRLLIPRFETLQELNLFCWNRKTLPLYLCKPTLITTFSCNYISRKNRKQRRPTAERHICQLKSHHSDPKHRLVSMQMTICDTAS